ncbi:hypothetical protein ACIBK9_51685 [Nonomuraea sp. NPDC050227]|uniref:hypothetical protein n=1 Tax=Nonomuraea sp. NPDC050227 TaxID=3364360 RepID=UPI0037AE6C47
MRLVRMLSVRVPVRMGPVAGAMVGRVALAMVAVVVGPSVVLLLVGQSRGLRGSGRSWSGGRSPGWP